MRFLGLSTFAVLLLSPLALCGQSPGSVPQKTMQSCEVELESPTAGETALAREDYDTALTFYRAQLKQDPSSQEAELGIVRSLIGKDETAQAIEEANKGLASHPGTALAEIAAGEAAYRNADFNSMRQHAQAAVQDNPCGGRGLALFARFSSLFALFATEAQLLNTAHMLRPNDELIRRAWIQSLPRKERTAELAKYLDSSPALSSRELRNLTNIEDHLKARRPDECRITTRSDNLYIPFVPVYGESSHPVAYGLDVAFNGKHRKMQVDTGASGIVLTMATAKRLGLEPEFRTHATGVGDSGEVDSYLTHVADIRIGGLEVSDCLVEVLQTSTLDVDGLIGIDVFDRWLVTLDYQNAQLRLNPLPPRPDAPADGARQPAGTAQLFGQRLAAGRRYREHPKGRGASRRPEGLAAGRTHRALPAAAVERKWRAEALHDCRYRRGPDAAVATLGKGDWPAEGRPEPAHHGHLGRGEEGLSHRWRDTAVRPATPAAVVVLGV